MGTEWGYVHSGASNTGYPLVFLFVELCSSSAVSVSRQVLVVAGAHFALRSQILCLRGTCVYTLVNT